MRVPITLSVPQLFRKPRSHRYKTALAFWIFAGPLMLGLVLFAYLPILVGLRLSFFSAQYTVTPQTFVGWRNYVDLLHDPLFLRSLGVFTIFAAFIVPITFICSLGLAVLVNRLPFLQGFFRSVFFLPSACSIVAASIIWKASLFNGSYYGLVNTVLSWFHQQPINWLGSQTPPWYWMVVVLLRLWLGLGFNMIIFLAGLQEIPRELYEAAAVDGARPGWQTFRSITFPLLHNTSVFILTLNVISAFQAFDEFYNLFHYGAGSIAQSPLVYLYSVSFADQDFGHGAAGAFILVAIILVITILQGRLTGFGRALS
jgi:multiple sugar transport system permease protein